MSTSRGVDRGSLAIHEFRAVHPASEVFLNQVKLATAINKLCARVEGHNHFAGTNQVAKISIRVGIRIFNIARDLGFVGGQCHAFGLSLLEEQDLRLLHKLR